MFCINKTLFLVNILSLINQLDTSKIFPDKIVEIPLKSSNRIINTETKEILESAAFMPTTPEEIELDKKNLLNNIMISLSYMKNGSHTYYSYNYMRKYIPYETLFNLNNNFKFNEPDYLPYEIFVDDYELANAINYTKIKIPSAEDCDDYDPMPRDIKRVRKGQIGIKYNKFIIEPDDILPRRIMYNIGINSKAHPYHVFYGFYTYFGIIGLEKINNNLFKVSVISFLPDVNFDKQDCTALTEPIVVTVCNYIYDTSPYLNNDGDSIFRFVTKYTDKRTVEISFQLSFMNNKTANKIIAILKLNGDVYDINYNTQTAFIDPFNISEYNCCLSAYYQSYIFSPIFYPNANVTYNFDVPSDNIFVEAFKYGSKCKDEHTSDIATLLPYRLNFFKNNSMTSDNISVSNFYVVSVTSGFDTNVLEHPKTTTSTEPTTTSTTTTTTTPKPTPTTTTTTTTTTLQTTTKSTTNKPTTPTSTTIKSTTDPEPVPLL